MAPKQTLLSTFLFDTINMTRTRGTKRKLNTVVFITDDGQAIQHTIPRASVRDQLYPSVPWVPSQTDRVPRNATQRSSTAPVVSSGPNKDKKPQAWASLLPDLLMAYQQGHGAEPPLPQALEPIRDQLLCACKHQTKDVVCVFKCGKYRVFNSYVNKYVNNTLGIVRSTIAYCNVCPGQSLPVVLMRRHLFPMTPTTPGIAIHVEQMRSLHNMHYVCRSSIHAIASWVEAEYNCKVSYTIA